MSLFRPLILLTALSLIVLLILKVYIIAEFIKNKGPDDLGVDYYAYQDLKNRYGVCTGGFSIGVRAFNRANPENSKGIYIINFKWNEKKGISIINYTPEKPHFSTNNVQLDK